MHEDLTSSFATSLAAIGGFETHPDLAIAVSGGPDSMALLLLAHHWTTQHGGRVIALTVDHGLRPESADEATQVTTWCAQRGIEHHLLRVQDSGFDIQGKMQDAAREARYHLLTNWCRKHHVLHLLTAHHLGDQAETLFFRLARGSGLDGLACMSPLSCLHEIRLLRPLLSMQKPQLEDFLTHNGQAWIEDPSNKKTLYTRNRIRQNLEHSGQPDDLMAQAGTLANRFGVVRNRLENNTVSYIANTISLFPEGYTLIHNTSFRTLAPEYGMRILARLFETICGLDHPPRTASLERLYGDMATGKMTRRRTLGGCQFIPLPHQEAFLVMREMKALGKPLPLERDRQTMWDNRFAVSWNDGPKNMEILEIRALGTIAAKALRETQPSLKCPPASVMATLPAFMHLEQLVAVPHMEYTHPDFQGIRCKAQFCPAKALAAQAFFSDSHMPGAACAAGINTA